MFKFIFVNILLAGAFYGGFLFGRKYEVAINVYGEENVWSHLFV